MARLSKWDYKQRQNLKFLLLEGYQLGEISQAMHLSIPTIKLELMRGLSEEEGRLGRYVKYNPDLSLRNYVIELIGEEGLAALMRYENGKSKE